MNQTLLDLRSYCLNPKCSEPTNLAKDLFCSSCGAQLLLHDRYRAIRQLGQGGFGRTLLAIAESQSPPLLCVVKQFWSDGPNIRNPKQAQSLFQREIDQLAELGNHPQIPALLDSCEQGDYLYLVQEYIAGENLATVLAETGRLSAIAVWQILESLLPVLQFIHSRGVIHRDIKPENIIRRSPLTPASPLIKGGTRGNLFLVDFGAAKRLTELALTQLGTTIGSAEYAAPEQVKGKAVFASDLYSLGVTCIHLLTGVRPFNLFDFASNQWSWRDDWLLDVPVSDDDHRLADVLDRLIEAALSKRFSSAEAAIAEIQILRGTKIPIITPAPKPIWVCYATLVGHQGLFANINAVAIDSSGSILASASDDKTIRVWDLQTGKELITLRGHTQFVRTVIFHPDDQTALISGSCGSLQDDNAERTIKLWNLQEQRELYTLAGHQHHVNALAFSSDGQLLASGSSDKTIKLWNFQTGEQLATLSGHTLAVNAIAFSPSCNSGQNGILASASSDSTIRIWDLKLFESTCTLIAHTSAVKAIAFSPNGTLLATGGEDRTIRLWDTASWQCVRVLSGHPWAVSALTFSPDGTLLISGSWDKTVKVWQVSTGTEMAVLTGHTDSVNCVAIAPNGNVIASGSRDKTIKLWRRGGMKDEG